MEQLATLISIAYGLMQSILTAPAVNPFCLDLREINKKITKVNQIIHQPKLPHPTLLSLVLQYMFSNNLIKLLLLIPYEMDI